MSEILVIARSVSDEAIQLSVLPRHGLLRFARNDGNIAFSSRQLHNIPRSTTFRRGTMKIIVEAQASEIMKIAAVSGSVVVEWPPR